MAGRAFPARSQLWMCDQSTGQDSAASTSKLPRDMKPEVKELRSVLKKCSLYLIGPMGSGKSAIGKYLAFELGFRFLDTDELIESVENKSISDIFKESGEEGFRDLEAAILDQVQPFIGCCVATGGGVVLRKENWGKLQTGIVVYLEAPVDVLVERLKKDTTRPLLADADDLAERVSSILNARRYLYEQADVTVSIGAGDLVDKVGKEVVRTLTNFIKANPPRAANLHPGNLPQDGK